MSENRNGFIFAVLKQFLSLTYDGWHHFLYFGQFYDFVRPLVHGVGALLGTELRQFDVLDLVLIIIVAVITPALVVVFTAIGSVVVTVARVLLVLYLLILVFLNLLTPCVSFVLPLLLHVDLAIQLTGVGLRRYQ